MAELDKGLKTIGNEYLFKAKKVTNLAYKYSKGLCNVEKDYVSNYGFRYFLLYERKFFEYWVMFYTIDVSVEKYPDGRLALNEFEASSDFLKEIGCTNPQACFNEALKNKGKKLLFEDFAKWATDKNLILPGTISIEETWPVNENDLVCIA